MIPEDHAPVLLPEKAPISYVDQLLWPSERLVTPEISSFQHTPTDDQNTRIHVPRAVKNLCHSSSSESHSLLSYELLPHTTIEARKDGLGAYTEPRYSQRHSSSGTSVSREYEQHGSYEFVSITPTRTTPMQRLKRPDRDLSRCSPLITRGKSVYMSVEEGPSKISELTDITDTPLRLKVAQLLAIAPELQIQDLCNLLIGTKGNVEKAREPIFRQAAWSTGLSSTPDHTQKVKTEVEEPFRYQSDRSNAMMAYDSDRDEDMVLMKLEADDSEIWYDNKALASPAPETRNLKEARPAKKNYKASPKLTSGKNPHLFHVFCEGLPHPLF
ncbi:hypothetical protein PMIN06_005044 [Paraphaeosphaeria minitans]|uniref:Uncharacterized protein n=1 Tax=Paraphaeosphaeria minitans TaxID=565426 RepID=A0A9P6KLF6_9PLEO|nr:hypothetical protein PMIN01_10795 [Paraphaeosphaeria minitans]